MAEERPKTRYARNGDVHIAYQVVGEGDRDLVVVPGYVTHLDYFWDERHLARFNRKLASFTRLIMFDKRGTGLSDPVDEVPTLEQRMDDVRAVMDDAKSDKATLFGISEGAPMSILFAATHPDRCEALILHGGMARSTWAEDYPWAAPAEALREALEMMEGAYGTGDDIEVFAPSLADDPEAKEWWGRFERSAASPKMFMQIFEMFLDVDVRHVLPAIHIPTLLIHRKGDPVVNVRAARWLTEQIEGSRLVELPGIDHLPWSGDADSVTDEIQEFLTGVRGAREADRILATVMFTDIVTSSERAALLGDKQWRNLLEAHDTGVRKDIDRFGGRTIKSTGDGVLATFDGPARAVRAGQAIVETVRRVGLEARVGLHCGEVEVIGEDIGGIAVHIAARVSALAGTGEVLVSGTIKDLVAGSGLQFDDRGAQELKGIPDQWRIFAVI